MKAEESKQQFLQSYTPGNYTDEEFGEMASEFEKDLDELLDEVSQERAEKAFKAGMVYQQFDTTKDFDDWWNWLKEQEEQP